MLYQLRRDDFYNNIKEPEYLIYIFISDHINRLDKFKIEPFCTEFQPKYKLSGKHLVQEKPSIFSSLISVQAYQYYYNYIFKKQNFNSIYPYFLEARDALHKHWPNTKFVIAYYPTEYNDSFYKSIDIEQLKNDGFIFINLGEISDIDLVDNKYKVDGWHPSYEAWLHIVPLLMKALNVEKNPD